jgi:glutaredoxin
MEKIINWVKENKVITIISFILLVGFLYLIFGNKKDKTNLAVCLKDKGAKFYGASWCPHCKNQKALFSNPQDLPYIECTDADNKKECQEAGVTGYPTWIFADGKKVSGELSIAQLKQYANC